MAKSKESFNKKDRQQKRQKQKQDKQNKKEERRANVKKGKSLEEMLAYVDENGNISDTPPDPRRRKTINAEDVEIRVRSESTARDFSRVGIIQFFNEEKGYGFIIDKATNEKIFVHASNLAEPVKAADQVTFEAETGTRGKVAVRVKKTAG